jgi:hypothetical protein
MAKVVPAPVEPSIILQFDGVAPARTSRRRQSTSSRFEGLSQDEKHQALAFRALVQPRTRYSLLATLVVCALLVLLVGVPYALNERMADANPVLQTAMRGLIVGMWMYFIIGPIFLVNAPTIVRGGFHPRFLLSLPLTLGPAVGAMLVALFEQQHHVFWISAALMLAGGALVAFFAGEVKQLAGGPWRMRWIGGLRDLLLVPRIGLLYLLGFLFMIMWYGGVTVITVFMLKILDARGADAAQEAYWVGAAAMAMAVGTVIALPFWGRVLDRIGPQRVLVFASVATIVTHLPLLVIDTPLQVVITRAAFGLSAAAMPTALVQLIRIHAPAGMDARAISYSTAFQFFAMGIAPFSAGLIGPALGLRVYFALTILLMAGGLWLWMRRTGR